MSLQELINKAAEESPTFKRKFIYWTVTRKKKPELDWLMDQLEEALGAFYVREAAKQHVKVQYDE